jgi:hypothetical protein
MNASPFVCCSEQVHFPLCVAVNECLDASLHTCDVETAVEGVVAGTCEDTEGSFTCTCPDGYEYGVAGVPEGCKGNTRCT